MGVALGVMTLAVGVPAAAQDDQSGEEALDALRVLVPQGDPGEYDITEADAIYGQIAELVGLSTAVEDFGDGRRVFGRDDPPGRERERQEPGGLLHKLDVVGRLEDARQRRQPRDLRQAAPLDPLTVNRQVEV